MDAPLDIFENMDHVLEEGLMLQAKSCIKGQPKTVRRTMISETLTH